MDIDSGSKSPTHAPASSVGSKDVKYSESPPTAAASTPGSGSGTSGPSSSAAGTSTSAAAAAPVLGTSSGKLGKRSASQALHSGPSAARSSGIPADRFLGAAALGRVVPIPATLTGGSITQDRDALIREQLRVYQISQTQSGPVRSGASAAQQLAALALSHSERPNTPRPLGNSPAQEAGTSTTQPQPPRPITSLPKSSATSLSEQLSGKANDQKAQQWLSAMRARSAAGPRPGGRPVLVSAASAAAAQSAAADVDMGAGPPRSIREGVRFAESASDGDADSEVGSVAGADSTDALLQAQLDVAVFIAECLSKLSGVPMPDFEADSADTGGDDQ